jgi:hypothetical protein
MKHCIVTFLVAAVSLLQAADDVQFNRDVRPILSDKCFHCHGPSSERKADLRLDTFEGATDARRKGGAALVPGKPNESLVIDRILTDDPDDIMPPPESHKSLTTAEKETLAKWVKQGAVYQPHWAYISVAEPAPGTSIDGYVDARLPSADRRTRIRRVTLDLTGLPPTQEEIASVLKDDKPGAYERLVDRLLASPRYGEHMARYWLDLVRYGDSHGIHADNYREMFLYRDWVIRAFNANQPFDAFVIDQVAGDLHAQPSTEHLVASGFNRLHISNSAGSALEAELYVNNVTDRVNAVGTVFLGLTTGCASCHDHKYDPISQKEYYQLFAFFNNLDGPPDNKGHKSPVPNLAVPTAAQTARNASFERQLKTADAASRKKLAKQIADLKKAYPTTLIMRERATPRPAYVLIRGEYDNQGERVERGTPAFLPPMRADLSRDRMGFAKWLVDPQHPLVARVAVNRFWQQLFGVGLVKTSEDFGSQGEWPSHPQLLDYLAHHFVSSDWDVKSLMRLMVTSDTYKQRSDAGAAAYSADPENRLLARGPRFRMDAEVLRDQALFVSDQLVDQMYGPSVKPPQPSGLWKSVSLPGVSRPDRFTPDKGGRTVRRSVYTYIKRAYPPPAMTIFNARTNTPLQALVLMNEEQFFNAARELARLSIARHDDDAGRLQFAYERLTAQPLPPEEQTLMLEALVGFRDHFKARPDSEVAAWTMIMNAMMNLDIVKTKQ